MSTNIELVAKPSGSSVEWEIDGGPAKNHKIKVSKGAAPETINFKLKDRTNLGLAFDTEAPLQVCDQPGCPPPAGINTDQIQLSSSSSDKVSIVDLNTGPAVDLQYQLNVVASDGTPFPCDPIINNGGAGPGR